MSIATSVISQTVAASVPYACAAMGGVLCERSGVVNIALEGTLLASALAAVAVQLATSSPLLGIVGGVACGAAVGGLHALLAVRGRIDAIVSGLAINLVAAAGTRIVSRALFGSSSNSPSIRGLHFFDGQVPLLRALLDPFFLASVALVFALVWMLRRTRFGLRLRACGEDPSAAEAVGIHVTGTRTAAVCLGGAVCGLGGTAFAYDLHQFQAGMSSGRGFIALAAVIISGWHPKRAALACLAFASFDAMQVVLQNHTRVPAQILSTFPYVATLVALMLVGRRRSTSVDFRPPEGLGKHPS